MDERRIGDILRERREQLRLSTQQASMETNLRERVLQAFEESDYAHFPPRGYAQGMLSSYARYLNIDPQEIVSAFNVEMDTYEQGREIEQTADAARKGTRHFGDTKRPRQMTAASRPQRDVRSSRSTQGESYAEAAGADPNQQERRPSTTVRMVSRHKDRTPPPSAHGAVLGDQITRTPEVDTMRHGTEPVKTSHGHGLSQRSSTRSSQTPSSRSRDRGTYSREVYVNQNIFERIINGIVSIFSERRTRLIAIAVILLVVALGIAANILVSTAGNSTNTSITPQGGTTTDSTAATATVTTTDGTSLDVSIQVASGATSVVTVTYDDNSAYNGTAVGPWSRDFQVTESLTATFSNPSAVTVMANDKQIQIQKQSDGTGKVSLSVSSASINTDDSSTSDTDTTNSTSSNG